MTKVDSLKEGIQIFTFKNLSLSPCSTEAKASPEIQTVQKLATLCSCHCLLCHYHHDYHHYHHHQHAKERFQ